jgi:hypothetical protein
MDMQTTYHTPLAFKHMVDTSPIEFPVEKKPIYGYRPHRDEYIKLSDKYEIVRTDNHTSLGVVGSKYELDPYINHVNAVKQAVTEMIDTDEIDGYNAKADFRVYEGGRKMNLTIDFPCHTIEPQIDDIVKFQFKDSDSYNQTWARRLNYQGFRLWCLNGETTKDFNVGFYSKHTKSISSDESTARMIMQMKLAVQSFKSDEQDFKRWARTHVERNDVLGVFKKTLASYENGKTGDTKVSDNKMLDLKKMLQSNTNHLGWTVWAVYNAATEWATHLDRGVRQVRGAAHNVERSRQTDVAKMLRSNPWKEMAGTE